MLEDGGGKGTGTSSTSQCDTEMLCSGEGKDMAWERGLRSKSRICPKGILPWRSPKWEERAGGKLQLKHLEQLSNCKWLLPCHSIPVSPNTGPEARDEERFIKGIRNRGMSKLRWPSAAGSADKNVAESKWLQFIPAQSHNDNWPWRKRSKSLQTLISSSLKWADQAFSTGLLWDLNHVQI